jgi:hypothetical protein
MIRDVCGLAARNTAEVANDVRMRGSCCAQVYISASSLSRNYSSVYASRVCNLPPLIIPLRLLARSLRRLLIPLGHGVIMPWNTSLGTFLLLTTYIARTHEPSRSALVRAQ